MSEYPITNGSRWQHSIKIIKDFINSLFYDESNEINLELVIPSNVIFRTQMICDYISKELMEDFEIYDFIMLLYTDFLDLNITNYNPLRVLNDLSIDYHETIYLRSGNDLYVHRKEYNEKLVIVTMHNLDANRGQTLLAELEDLYGKKISLSKMLTNIWLNFMEKYKRGSNPEVLKSIIKILKEQEN